jgi:argininosuccinate lyase
VSGTLWGGRFRGELDPEIRSFTGSLSFDRRVARHDLVASLAHVRMLVECGVLAPEDGRPVLAGLSGLLDDLEKGEVAVEGDDEDVHSWIERTLRERIGEAAGRVHTARSRNDQTAVALRLYLRGRLEDLVRAVAGLVEALMDGAEDHLESWMPGYTHLQRAQPVSLAHHLLAHARSLLDDAGRFRRVHRTAGRSPLGAGALAGTSHSIDPELTAELLGLEAPYDNSLLAVADRDHVAEAVFACALLMTHLSRWAEELILWTSPEFGFAELSDEVAQGSSLMPQKRNPEAPELIRGKTGRVSGDLTAVLTVLKGLPLAYDSDLQEDKEALFDALDTAHGSLRAAERVVRGTRYRTERMREALSAGHLTATDLADHLVRRGVPFRTAHEQAGRAVRAAKDRRCQLWELPLEELRRCCPEVGKGVRAELEPEAAGRRYAAGGGPAPESVGRQLRCARRDLRDLREWAASRPAPPIYRAHLDGTLLP